MGEEGSDLGAAPVQGPLRVVIGDGSTGNVYTDQGPVDLQVDGDQQQVLLEDIDLAGSGEEEAEMAGRTLQELSEPQKNLGAKCCCC